MKRAPVAQRVDRADAYALRAPWRALADRAEPNVFADPDFLLPLIAHCAPGRLMIVAVWADADRAELIGLAAVTPPPIALGFAKVWMHPLAAAPALLIDPARAASALSALLGALSAAHIGAGLLIPHVEVGSALMAALEGRAHRLVARTARAALPCERNANFADRLSPKRKKEWGRQRRRLADGEGLEFAVPGRDIEPFLRLEASGWKGARGTALAQSADSAAFARQMAKNFAARGAIAVHTMTRGGALIAAGIVLRGGRRAYYWKTAFDERLAALSPGVQLTLAMSARLEKDPGLDLADSCAVADHPMIDRLWPARLRLDDVALPLGAATPFHVARKAHEWRAALRARAKALAGH